MRLEDLLNQPEYSLPARNNTGRPFLFFLNSTIESYLHKINSSQDLLEDYHSGLVLDLAEFKEIVNFYGSKIIEVIRYYNQYDIVKATNTFNELMKPIAPIINNYEGAMFYSGRKADFYRSKFFPTTDLQDKTRFFHTPYELSGKVSGTRFSPPGIPALYLANSLVVGYLEVRATSITTFQGVRFKPNSQLSFLDIDFNKPDIVLKTTKPDLYNEQMQIKGLLFPLLLACYTIQEGNGVVVPPEYIIPQFLTKWVRDNNRLTQGIKYSSTKISKPPFSGTFYNLIIPTINVKEEGYCDELKKLFQMSDVCSGELHKADFDTTYNAEFFLGMNINPMIDKVELDNVISEYNATELGKMEFFLNRKLSVNKISF
jgi:hypothetical protein